MASPITQPKHSEGLRANQIARMPTESFLPSDTLTYVPRNNIARSMVSFMTASKDVAMFSAVYNRIVGNVFMTACVKKRGVIDIMAIHGCPLELLLGLIYLSGWDFIQLKRSIFFAF